MMKMNDKEWWFEFRCPKCGHQPHPLPLTTLDTEEHLWCPRCEEVVATRPQEHVGDISYISSYNLTIASKLMVLEAGE